MGVGVGEGQGTEKRTRMLIVSGVKIRILVTLGVQDETPLF